MNTQDKQDTGAPGRRLIPVTDWSTHHAWPTTSGLRSLIFFAGDNNFQHVIRRVGRRVLIDEVAFFAWVDAQNGGHHD